MSYRLNLRSRERAVQPFSEWGFGKIGCLAKSEEFSVSKNLSRCGLDLSLLGWSGGVDLGHALPRNEDPDLS
ncbi:hypothetical protein VDG1235_4578 [Verrucomicrobiia bacterium DG1235]|nr:hypothetical protein VDG1235_4578 [Verrucomicrobiae bacterium DG1235]